MANQFHCPHCQTLLKLSATVPAGKLIQCPKCVTRFPVPAEAPAPAPAPVRPKPRPPADEESEDYPPKRRRVEEPEEDEELPRKRRPVVADEDDDDRPRRRQDDDEDDDRPRRRKKKRKKSGSGKVLLLALTGLFVLLLLGGGGTLAWVLWPAGDTDPIAYLPEESNVIITWDYGALKQKAPNLLAKFEQITAGPTIMLPDGGVSTSQITFFSIAAQDQGVDFAEFCERVYLAHVEPPPGTVRPPSPPGTTALNDSVVVIRTKKPYDKSKLLKAFNAGDPEDQDGHKYYPIGVDGLSALLLPSNRVIVGLGVPASVRGTVLAADGKKPLLPDGLVEALRAAANTDIALVAPLTADNNKKFHQSLEQLAANPQVKGAARLKEIADPQAMLSTLHVEGGQVRIALGLSFGNGSQASQAADIVRTVLNGNMAPLKSFIGFFGGADKDQLLQVLDTLKIDADGTQARLAIQLSLATVEKILQQGQTMARQGRPGGGRPGGGP